ncbi:MAG TPA: redox-sensing transcriptional repressor Rex [Pyrinomonadaceae bacterium]
MTCNARDYREARHHSQMEVSRAGDAALYFDGTRVMKKEKISELTTNRLSVYLRCLNELAAAGIKTVSSQDLAEQFNLNSAQIRKDLGYFGEFGVRGTGYFIEDLRRHLTKILGLDQPHRVAIIGAGRLGTALANYNGLSKSNFSVVALFDDDPEKVGENVGSDGIPVHDVKQLAKMVRDEGIDVAVIAVPARAAQKVLNQIMAAGVKAILNFAPAPLTSRLGVKVKTVDLTTSLESLSYFLAQPGVARVTNSTRTNDANSAHKRQTHEI